MAFSKDLAHFNSLDANPYFHFDSKSKEIKDLVFKCRGMIINERLWARINREIMDLMKESGPLIMYQLGLSYGYEVGQHGRNIIKDHTTAVNFS